MGERVGVVLRVPVSQRRLVAREDGVTERASATGLADPEVSLQWKLWSSRFEGEVTWLTSDDWPTTLTL